MTDLDCVNSILIKLVSRDNLKKKKKLFILCGWAGVCGKCEILRSKSRLITGDTGILRHLVIIRHKCTVQHGAIRLCGFVHMYNRHYRKWKIPKKIELHYVALQNQWRGWVVFFWLMLWNMHFYCILFYCIVFYCIVYYCIFYCNA